VRVRVLLVDEPERVELVQAVRILGAGGSLLDARTTATLLTRLREERSRDRPGGAADGRGALGTRADRRGAQPHRRTQLAELGARLRVDDTG